MPEKHIGRVEHYYPRVHAAAVHLQEAGLKVGDTVHIIGHGTNLTEKVQSLELEHQPIDSANPGQHVGLLVDEPVHAKADVYLVS